MAEMTISPGNRSNTSPGVVTDMQRQGAGAVYLNAHHPDIMMFLDTKRENADEKIRIKTLSLGVVIPDITFHLAKENREMYLFSPYDVERVEGKPFSDLSVTDNYDKWVEDPRIAKRKVRAREFFRTLSELQFESGYPYVMFEDTANRFHPMKHAGRINMSNLCQIGSARINTSKGYRRLDDLYNTQEEIEVVVDERARTLDSTNKGVSVQASSKMFKTAENAEVYRVKTREGFENISTLWHKYYVYRDGNLIKIPLAEVVPGDKFPVQSEKSPSFGLVNDVETAYLAGAYASDGNLTRRSENHIMSTIDLFGGKQEYMERIEDYAEKSIERHGVKGTGMESPKFQDSGDGGIRMYSASLAKAFVLAGVNERDNTEVPEFVFQGTEETVKAYLSGRLSLDGSVYSCTPGSWTFSITSINEKSLRDMQKLLLSLGVYSRIYKVNRAGDSHVQVDSNGKEVVWNHSDASRLIVTGWDSCNILEEIVDFKASHKATIEEAKQKCKVTRSSRHNHMATVESIEFYGIEDVYDVTVDNGHSVIFDGIATGQCSEIQQLNSASVLNDDLTYETVGADISCNLGSLNVKKMLDLTRDEFVDTVQVAVRALTAVSTMTNIDSVPSVREGNNLSRAIGLGQMNLHGALAHHGLRYGSEEALKLWDNYMALVTWAAMCESAELAREIGETPYFDGSEYATGEWWERVPKAHLERAESLEIMPGLDAPDADDWNDLHLKVSQHGMANAYLQTIPPTGSISYINNSTSSIHPIVNKVEIRKEGKVGRVYYPAPHMRSDNLHLYEDAYEIGPERVIDTYATSQQWVDQSQSLTLFFPDTATTRDLDKARIYAWRKGIRTMYYVRLRQMALDGTGVTETGVAECESCLL